MQKRKEVTEVVKSLEVDKAEFDRVLKKLIATPPIRKADLPKRKK